MYLSTLPTYYLGQLEVNPDELLVRGLPVLAEQRQRGHLHRRQQAVCRDLHQVLEHDWVEKRAIESVHARRCVAQLVERLVAEAQACRVGQSRIRRKEGVAVLGLLGLAPTRLHAK